VYPCPCSCSACPGYPAQRPAAAALCYPEPPRPAPRYSTGRPRPSLPLARLSSVLSATDPNTDTGEGLRHPPLMLYAWSAPDIKISPISFRPPENPGLEHPPGIYPPKKFSNPKSGLGTGRRWAGAVAASGRLGDGFGETLAAAPGYPCLPLGVPFRGRGGAVSGPQRRRFIVPQGVAGGKQPGEGRRRYPRLPASAAPGRLGITTAFWSICSPRTQSFFCNDNVPYARMVQFAK